MGNSGVAFWVFVTIFVILFHGEPSLMDAIITNLNK